MRCGSYVFLNITLNILNRKALSESACLGRAILNLGTGTSSSSWLLFTRLGMLAQLELRLGCAAPDDTVLSWREPNIGMSCRNHMGNAIISTTSFDTSSSTERCG